MGASFASTTYTPDNLILGGEVRSRGITLLSGQDLVRGAVLGKITLGAAVGAPVQGNAGNATITAAPTLGAGAKAGVYRATCRRAITTAVLGAAVGAAVQGNAGNATITAAPVVGAGCKAGVYRLVCIEPAHADALGAAVGAVVAGNTGDGTITAAPVVGAGCKAGVYRLTCIEPAENAGKFQVEDPDGIVIGVATVGAEFATHLTFTIADGANADFVAGDSFTITVATTRSDVAKYAVEDPDGIAIGVAAVGTEFATHLTFTITGGNTLSAAGDAFTITVAVTLTDVSQYEVRDPDGILVGTTLVGTAFAGPVNFTLTAGNTASAAGDAFTVTVAAGSGSYKSSVAAAVDGSQVPDAILAEDTDASDGDVATVAYFGGEFTESALTLGAGHTAAGIREGLRVKGIYLIAAQTTY